MVGKSKNNATFILVFLTVCYCIFVLMYEKKTAATAELRLQEHALIVADDLWNYNYKGASEYLKLAADSDHYRKLSVVNHNGDVFQDITTHIPTATESIFLRLYLLSEVLLVAPIEYKGKYIGWIEVNWIPQTLFTHLAVLGFAIMIWLVILLYLRIIGEKNLLEVRVKERTNELTRSNLVLRKEIKERSIAEKALHESERKYRFLAEKMEDVIWTLNYENKCIYMSPVVSKMFGWDPEDLEGTTLEILFSSDSLEIFQHVLKEGWSQDIMEEDTSDPQRVELEMIHRDNSTLWCEITITYVTDAIGAPQGTMSVSRNITERRNAQQERERLQEKLESSKKMESLGLLAGGVAHDLNNVLSGIVSYPELILLDMPEESPVRKKIETIRDSGVKAAEIVQDLLTLARRGVVTTKIVNINDLVREYTISPEYKKMISYHGKITVQHSLDENLPNIYGSSVQIKKVIMNLVSNAAEAQPNGGKILITTESRYVEVPLERYQIIPPGEYVVLTVQDSGEGIPDAELKRIFEPFYTKKVMGRSGTGLGLTVVWGTIEDHKAFIDIKSDVNKGTTIDLYFPMTRDVVEGSDAEPVKKDFLGKGQSVLIVDDVEYQREIASAILSRLNYSAVSVSSGEEAVSYLQDNDVDLVILDMIMGPGLDGLDTYKEILKIKPKQRAIIASGYSATDRVKEALRIGAGNYVQKPYILEKIAEVVLAELK